MIYNCGVTRFYNFTITFLNKFIICTCNFKRFTFYITYFQFYMPCFTDVKYNLYFFVWLTRVPLIILYTSTTLIIHSPIFLKYSQKSHQYGFGAIHPIQQNSLSGSGKLFSRLCQSPKKCRIPWFPLRY